MCWILLFIRSTTRFFFKNAVIKILIKSVKKNFMTTKILTMKASLLLLITKIVDSPEIPILLFLALAPLILLRQALN